jgi:large subunit ribosomal protein L31
VKRATCGVKPTEETMKDKIHPNYKEATIVCACGETIRTRSTKPNIRIEVCSKCHPFFTGKQKLLDSAGRVDKFMKKYAKK